MANIRKVKKDLTFLTEELISDAYVAIYFQPNEKKDAILAVINKAVDMNNTMLERINHPADKHNTSLVSKHYAQIRKDMLDGISNLFDELSNVCQETKAAKAE